MRVSLDATPLLGTRTGVGAFVSAVADGLVSRADIDLTLFALTWRGRGALGELAPPGSRVVTAPLPARPLRSAWRRGMAVSIDRWLGDHDVVHGTNFVVPPSRSAQVVTVHDLTCVRFPELCTPDTLEYPRLIRRAVERGAWVHTPSHAVADEVTTLLGVPPERVRAVANGANLLPPSDPSDGRRLAGAGRYILGLGTIEPRKDFPTLVEAFSLLAGDDPDLHLVIAGPDGWGVEALEAAIARSPAPERIRRMGWVDTESRSALLAGAEVLAFASRYEGFGLPVLEAHGLGTPVVTSDVGALREVAGDAAVFVPVGEPAELARAIHTLLTDPSTVDVLRRAGHANVTRYSWSNCVDGLVDLYTEAVAERG